MELYIRLLAASIRARMQYKIDFVLTALLYAVGASLEFLTLATILYRYPSIGGWGLYEVAILSGIANSSYALFRLFGPELNNFEKYLVTGEFDSVLIRPWPSLLTLLSRNFDLGRVGSTVLGYAMVFLGVRGVISQGAPLWVAPYAFLMPLIGAVVVAAMCLVTAAAGFWLTRIDELSTFTLNAPVTAGNYPTHIFPGWMRRLLTAVLPVATFGYFPLNYALGKGGAPWHLALPFISAVLSVWVSLQFWHWGERHYQSTGS